MGITVHNQKKFRIGIIGTGYMAFEHARAFAAHACVEITGVYGRDLAKAQDIVQRLQSGIACDSIDHLHELGTDLVVIAVSIEATGSLLSQCSRYDWFILCEKPFSQNVSSAREAIASLNQKKEEIFVAHNRRFYPSISSALEQLEESGGPRIVSIVDQEDTVSALSAGFNSSVVSDWMYANSIHVIDLFLVFCRGEIESVERVYATGTWTQRSLASVIKFDSGDIGFYQAHWNKPAPWAASIACDSCYIELSPLEYGKVRRGNSRKWIELLDTPALIGYKDGLVEQVEQAIMMLRGLSHSLVSISSSMDTMELISAIYDE